MNPKSTGRVTIPTDANFVEGSKEIAALWGADAVRDCDGVSLPKNAKEIAPKVYNTYFVVRGDNAWGRAHPEEAQRMFLESNRKTAEGTSLTIDVMEGFLSDEIDPDYEALDRWQVWDRTANKEVKGWEIQEGKVVIPTIPFHRYSVDFLARITWHPVQIYNYITNQWTCEKQLCYDPAYPNTQKYIREYLQRWLDEHPETNVVRFTTFLYQFNLVFNGKGKERMVDWFGYGEACSIPLLEGFEKETGIHLVAEDFVDAGRYNTPFKTPSKKFAAYMDYVQRFVSSIVSSLVEIVHRNGREAMMFLGDDWIGAEPYGVYFPSMKLDSVVGSVGGGVTVRMLGEIPGVKEHEGRFLPYFFPDTFFPGNEDNAVNELNRNWMTARRALLRCPLDRMGFGGYLSLAAQFPKFISRAGEICDEFRHIHDAAALAKPYSALKVGILNVWGKLRSWMSHMVAHELWYPSIYSYQGVLESLSGLPVEVEFLSFDEILEKGIPSDIDCLINVGEKGSAFSGGIAWSNPKLIEIVRSFVASGHGFIGIGEPSAYVHQGACFALSDILGVEEELGQTLSTDKYNIEKKPHFITEDVVGPIDYGEGVKNIYAFEGTDVLDILPSRVQRNVNCGEVLLAANTYFDGRGVYIAGAPYSPQNARLLYRSLLWASRKEKELHRSFLTNILTEITYYPGTQEYALINNASEEVSTDFYRMDGSKERVILAPSETRWVR